MSYSLRQHYLAKDAFFCLYGKHVVFLDLLSDRYTRLDSPHVELIHNLMRFQNDGSEGGPLHNGEKTNPSSDLIKLVERGLLTTDSASGKPVEPTIFDPPSRLLIGPDEDYSPPAEFRYLPAFLAANTAAVARLKWWRIQKTVSAVEKRKAKGLERNPEFNIDAAKKLTAVFKKLRLLFPRNYLCLFDSLALLEFLARYRVFPSWVFGVQLERWGAHCWVQEGPILFNDDLERVSGYKPIMVV